MRSTIANERRIFMLPPPVPMKAVLVRRLRTVLQASFFHALPEVSLDRLQAKFFREKGKALDCRHPLLRTYCAKSKERRLDSGAQTRQWFRGYISRRMDRARRLAHRGAGAEAYSGGLWQVRSEFVRQKKAHHIWCCEISLDRMRRAFPQYAAKDSERYKAFRKYGDFERPLNSQATGHTRQRNWCFEVRGNVGGQ